MLLIGMEISMSKLRSSVAFVPLDSRSALRVPHGGFRSSLRSRSTPPAPQLRLHSSPKVGLSSNTLFGLQYKCGLLAVRRDKMKSHMEAFRWDPIIF